MTQISTDLPYSPHMPPISVHGPPGHHQHASEELPTQGPCTTGSGATLQPPASRPQDPPAPPRPATPTVEPIDMDADTPWLRAPPPHIEHHQPPKAAPCSPPSQGPGYPSGLLSLAGALDPPHRQGPQRPHHPRAGPPRGHRGPLALGARLQVQNQHLWIPPIEWTQTLTHETNTYTNKKNTHLRRALTEKDHLADPEHAEE